MSYNWLNKDNLIKHNTLIQEFNTKAVSPILLDLQNKYENAIISEAYYISSNTEIIPVYDVKCENGFILVRVNSITGETLDY